MKQDFLTEFISIGKPKPEVSWEKDSVVLSESNVMNIETTDTQSTVHIRDARRTDSGQYTIHLKNVASSRSLAVSVKVLDSPGPPGTVTVTDITSSRARLLWTPPTDNGGANVTHYIVEKRETSRLTWTLVDSNVRLL